MDPIITDALTTAGEMSRTVARNLQATHYTVFDGWGSNENRASWYVADALIDDATGFSATNDRYVLHSSEYLPSAKHAARARMDRRTQLSDAVKQLSREDRIALIDALAAGRNVIAA